MDLRHLRYFVAVAEEGSFTAAARRVHITQQVLSTQIQQLETILGVQLLERSSRHVALTSAGMVLLEEAERLHAFHAAGFALIAGGAVLCCLTPSPMLSSPREAPRA